MLSMRYGPKMMTRLGLTAHRLMRVAFGATLGLVILSWVAANAGPTRGRVVVHVMESGVRLRIGEETIVIREPLRRPLVREMSAGEYTLAMSRGHDLLYEEAFRVEGGEWLVLTAFDPSSHVGDEPHRLTDPRSRRRERRHRLPMGVVPVEAPRGRGVTGDFPSHPRASGMLPTPNPSLTFLPRTPVTAPALP